MRKIMLIFALGLVGVSLHAQNWVWAENSIGLNDDETNVHVKNDIYNNVYVAGAFYSHAISFGGITLKNIDSTNDNFDIFFVKYNSSGNVVWAKSVGGDYDDIVGGIASDNEGNIYITGSFNSTSITFGNFVLNCSSPGSDNDIFIAKYDTSGNVVWAKKAGGEYDDEPSGITCDRKGNIMLTGFFNSPTIAFDSIILKDTMPGNDVFTVRYNSAGKVLWAKRGNGIGGINSANAITTDNNCNLYISGSFNVAITFDNQTLSYLNGIYDYFIVKYDSSGNVVWVKGAETSNSETYGITVDDSDNAYTIGFASSIWPNFIIVFGGDTILQQGDFFVKYDKYGNVLWAKSLFYNVESIFSDEGIATDGENVYLAGGFNGRFINVNGNLMYNTDASGKGVNIIVLKYDETGKPIWAKTVTGIYNGSITDISLKAGDDFCVTGIFSGPYISFGNSKLISSDTSETSSSIFTAQYGFPAGINEISALDGILIYPNPTMDIFYFQTNNLQGAKLNIYNTLGEILEQSVITNSNTEIDLSNVAAGIYFVQVVDGDKVYNGKVVKQ